MTDLIQRLRATRRFGPDDFEMLREAADQLESNAALIALLRASLRKVEDERDALKHDIERHIANHAADLNTARTRDFPDPVLWAIKSCAAINVDDWAERQDVEPSPETCDAMFVREIFRLVEIQV